MGDVWGKFDVWLDNNPWIYPVVSGVLVIFFLILDIYRRKKKIAEYDEQYVDNRDFFGTVKKRDITFLITNIIFMALPTIAYIVLYVLSTKQPESTIIEDYSMYVLLYCFFASLVLAWIRKDFLLLILWKIPTITLGARAHNAVHAERNMYEVTIDSNGHGTVSEYSSGFSFILTLIGVVLFVFKLCILIAYLVCSMLANFVLSTIIYPILYSVYIYKDSKYLKELN